MVVRNPDLPAVKLYNGLTQGQTKSQTSSAVGDLVCPSIKHIKNFFFLLVRDSRTVIGHRYFNALHFLLCMDLNN